MAAARLPGATSAPPALATHRRPPSVPGPRRLPAAWLTGPIPATIRISPGKAAFAPASILGRHKSVNGWRFRCGSGIRTRNPRMDPQRAFPGIAAPGNRSPCVRQPARAPPEPRICAVIWIIPPPGAPCTQQARPVRRRSSLPMDTHLGAPGGLELDDALIQLRRARRDQLDKSGPRRLRSSPDRTGHPLP